MPKKQKGQVSWSSGDIVRSQVVIGDDNTVVHNETPAISRAELDELQKQFSDLKVQIKAAAPSKKRTQALKKADELHKAVVSKKPDPSAMAEIRDWFVKNLPGIAGSVTGLVVNPIVGKLVEAAGDAVTGEFRRRFGS
jgi:hypothetical protein